MLHTLKRQRITFTLLVFCIFCFVSCRTSDVGSWTADDTNIRMDGKSSYFIGTNLWYAGRLASTEEGRQRLVNELDRLKELGLTNLRVLAVEGEDVECLRYALDRMHERNMSAVLFLNNAWEWSFGFADYLEKAGAGVQPRPATDGYTAYMTAMGAYSVNDKAVALNQEYIRNTVSSLKDHPAIFSWEICNEPRCFSNDPSVKDAFVKYIHSTASLIKSIDSKHMVTTGNEGTKGCEEDMELCRRINDCPDIDYITIHIWPYNWGWVGEDTVNLSIEKAVSNVEEYIDQHLHLAYLLRKPMVIEEFGFPRDGFSFERTDTTEGRDRIYDCVFSRVVKSAAESGRLAGCNFWGWGGFAEPAHTYWEEGDDLCGDPAQEQQGLNSVFVSDSSTIATIKKYTDELESMTRLEYDFDTGCLFTEEEERRLSVSVYNPSEQRTEINLVLISDLSLMDEAKDTVLNITSHVKDPFFIQKYDLSGLKPGFYQVKLSWNNETGSGVYPAFNIGVDPEKIISPQDKKEDFDDFWSSTLSELAGTPMVVRKEYSPEHSNELRNSYKVEITSWNGGVMGGILCEPAAAGKYPVYIDYMGYGAEFYWYDPSTRPEVVEFLVSVRDQGIFKDNQDRWIDRGLESKENFYYRGAFCDVIRAIDFVSSLEKVDTSRIFARGESQGGAFTLLAASLDSRIAAAAPAVPFLCDYHDYSHIVWWPMWEVFETADSLGIERDDLFDTLSYFDLKNFTDRIECPVLMAFGLQDPTCPPHTNFAGYNMIGAQKDYYCVPTCGHSMWEEKSWENVREAFFSRFNK